MQLSRLGSKSHVAINNEGFTVASEERLRNELARIQKKLTREQLTEEEREEARKKAKLNKLKSHKDFLTSQTARTIQTSINQVESKQLLLQSQIVKLQEWLRYYHSLLETRDEQLEAVQAKIDKLEGRAPVAEPTIESILAQWAYLQKLERSF